MELPIKSHVAGVIEAVNCQEGELVQPGAPLIEIEEADA
jgi:biotin carboxyl carrier protein